MKRPNMKSFLSFLLVIFLTVVLVKAFVYAVDTHIENQDAMLCNSALKSRNAEYLKKCDCFYKGNSITCLQAKEVSGYEK